mmetsp:Transcript_9882/g.28291  ORF Transcript_9882/g.28291 Transcript_9882/m.28291 type:complete len:348 (+) Transcript_9882:408-1451(+)
MRHSLLSSARWRTGMPCCQPLPGCLAPASAGAACPTMRLVDWPPTCRDPATATPPFASACRSKTSRTAAATHREAARRNCGSRWRPWCCLGAAPAMTGSATCGSSPCRTRRRAPQTRLLRRGTRRRWYRGMPLSHARTMLPWRLGTGSSLLSAASTAPRSCATCMSPTSFPNSRQASRRRLHTAVTTAGSSCWAAHSQLPRSKLARRRCPAGQWTGLCTVPSPEPRPADRSTLWHSTQSPERSSYLEAMPTGSTVCRTTFGLTLLSLSSGGCLRRRVRRPALGEGTRRRCSEGGSMSAWGPPRVGGTSGTSMCWTLTHGTGRSCHCRAWSRDRGARLLWRCCREGGS